MSTGQKNEPRIGDIVILKQGIGVIRYYGDVDFDSGKYYGIEMKGPSIPGGHNGKNKFKCKRNGRGIFVRSFIRVISSEEILEKLAEIYDILKGRRGHSHFIDRASYDELIVEHEAVKEELESKKEEIEDLERDLSLLKEKISIMRGTVQDKVDETAKLTQKINKAENKIGSRLSQINLDHVKQKLLTEKQPTNNVNIPQYDANANKKKGGGHRKQRSSTTIALDQLNDNFDVIAKNVSGYGNKDVEITSSPMHYRKFSNTTKQIMDAHKTAGIDINTQQPFNAGHKARDSMKIGNIVNENDLIYNDDEDDNNENENESKRRPKSRASRESRQLDDDEVNETELFDDDDDLDEMNNGNQQIVNVYDNNNNNGVVTNTNTSKRKARGSITQNEPYLNQQTLQTFHEHALEQDAAEINGPKDSHKRGDSMTSNSSEYKKFMQVD